MTTLMTAWKKYVSNTRICLREAKEDGAGRQIAEESIIAAARVVRAAKVLVKKDCGLCPFEYDGQCESQTGACGIIPLRKAIERMDK
jgi:hypothetical protein